MSNILQPMDCSTPGFPVLHHLLELSQTYVHWVSDAIQPYHLMSSPSPPAFNLSSGSFLMSRLFALGGQSIGASSVLPMNIQDWFSLGFIGLISLQSKGLSGLFFSRDFSWLFSRVSSKASILWHSAFFMRASLVAQLVKNLPAIQKTWVQSLGWEDPLEKGRATHSSILAWRIPWTIVSHKYMIIWKTVALTIWTFVGKVMSLPFNMLSSFVIAFLSRSKHILISWLQSSSAVYTKYKNSVKMLVSQSCPTLCNPMNCSLPGSSVQGILQSTGVVSHSLLQGIFLSQGLNSGFWHCRWILYHVIHQGSPYQV